MVSITNQLDGLSPEVLTLILHQVSSIQDLHSLVQASSQAYRVFLLSKARVLSAVVHHVFLPKVLPHAIAAIKASYLDRGPQKEVVIKFMDEYVEDQKVDHSELLLSLSTSIALCKLHRTIDFFIQDFTRRSISALQQCCQSNKDIAPPQTSEKLCAPLSIIEEARLQRAFTRFEIYGCLFYAKPYFTVTKWGASEQAQVFFAELPPWQIEELACVHDYFLRRLADVFDRAEDEFVFAELAEEPKPSKAPFDDSIPRKENFQKDDRNNEGEENGDESGTDDYSDVFEADWHDRWSEPDAFFSSSSKISDHEYYAEYMLSLGLPFFRRLFETSGEELRQLLQANAAYGEPFLTAALDEPPQQNQFIERERQLCSENAILAFGTDTVDGRNEAWLWSHYYKPAVRRNKDCSEGLRGWGYVFWDSMRLRASDIIGLRYLQPSPQSPEGSGTTNTDVSLSSPRVTTGENPIRSRLIERSAEDRVRSKSFSREKPKTSPTTTS